MRLTWTEIIASREMLLVSKLLGDLCRKADTLRHPLFRWTIRLFP